MGLGMWAMMVIENETFMARGNFCVNPALSTKSKNIEQYKNTTSCLTKYCPLRRAIILAKDRDVSLNRKINTWSFTNYRKKQ